MNPFATKTRLLITHLLIVALVARTARRCAHANICLTIREFTTESLQLWEILRRVDADNIALAIEMYTILQTVSSSLIHLMPGFVAVLHEVWGTLPRARLTDLLDGDIASRSYDNTSVENIRVWSEDE